MLLVNIANLQVRQASQMSSNGILTAHNAGTLQHASRKSACIGIT